MQKSDQLAKVLTRKVQQRRTRLYSSAACVACSVWHPSARTERPRVGLPGASPFTDCSPSVLARRSLIERLRPRCGTTSSPSIDFWHTSWWPPPSDHARDDAALLAALLLERLYTILARARKANGPPARCRGGSAALEDATRDDGVSSVPPPRGGPLPPTASSSASACGVSVVAFVVQCTPDGVGAGAGPASGCPNRRPVTGKSSGGAAASTETELSELADSRSAFLATAGRCAGPALPRSAAAGGWTVAPLLRGAAARSALTPLEGGVGPSLSRGAAT